mgnify:CR=1 FL=1
MAIAEAKKKEEELKQAEIIRLAKEEKRRRQEEKTLFETVDDFIEYAPKLMQDNGKPLSRGTLWQYGQMRRSLAEYATKCKRKDWEIKEVNGVTRYPILKGVDLDYTNISDIYINQELNKL